MSFKDIQDNKESLEIEIGKAVETAIGQLGDGAKQLDWLAGNADNSCYRVEEERNNAGA